jgi:hypothetical protein
MPMATLQVKRVPDDLYQRARDRAAAEGISLSEYVLRTLRRDLRLAPLREWVADVRLNPLPIGDDVDVHAILDDVKDQIEGS